MHGNPIYMFVDLGGGGRGGRAPPPYFGQSLDFLNVKLWPQRAPLKML